MAVPQVWEAGNVTLGIVSPAPGPAVSSAGLRWPADKSLNGGDNTPIAGRTKIGKMLAKL